MKVTCLQHSCGKEVSTVGELRNCTGCKSRGVQNLLVDDEGKPLDDSTELTKEILGRITVAAYKLPDEGDDTVITDVFVSDGETPSSDTPTLHAPQDE